MAPVLLVFVIEDDCDAIIPYSVAKGQHEFERRLVPLDRFI